MKKVVILSDIAVLDGARAQKSISVNVWPSIARFYNRLPLGITPCKSVYEAKMYTAVLLAVLTVFFFPLLLPTIMCYRSAKKGGRR
ncbi:MAG: hypothetical protein LUE98_04530 [Tannerellaceae bacterium]|nr:hypothetical protein [Tannerellaceae bacterium]